MPEHTTECPVRTSSTEMNFAPESDASLRSVKTIMVVVPRRLYRDGIAQTLRQKNRVVWSDSETLADARGSLQGQPSPDLIIVQIEKSAAQGSFTLIREMRAEMPESRWIILSNHSDPQFLKEAIEAGVDDCLSEDVSGEVLRTFTDLVLLGHSFMQSPLAHCFINMKNIHSEQYQPRFSNVSELGRDHACESDLAPPTLTTSNQSIMQRIDPVHPDASSIWTAGRPDPSSDATLQSTLTRTVRSGFDFPYLRAAEIGKPNASGFPLPGPRLHNQLLSDREQAILTLLVKGQANKTIARSLNIAEATVKVHVKALFRKMQVSNRTQAAIAASHYLLPMTLEKPQSVTVASATEDSIPLPDRNWSDQSYRAIGKL
jgi:DNA-binding NarL/FixJ family response regulator